jgi:hypothetical protein
MRGEKYRRELTAFRAFAMEKFKDGRNQVGIINAGLIDTDHRRSQNTND